MDAAYFQQRRAALSMALNASRSLSRAAAASEKQKTKKNTSSLDDASQQTAANPHADGFAAAADRSDKQKATTMASEVLSGKGIDATLEYAIRAPAVVASREDRQKAARSQRLVKNAASTHDPLGLEAQTAAHGRRLARAGIARPVSNSTKKRSRGDDDSGDEKLEDRVHSDESEERVREDMFGGDVLAAASAVSRDGVNRMVEELARSAKRRKSYSRERKGTGTDAGDFVTFINRRNEHFNKKSSRAFDRYTHDLRANIERGTAL